MSITSIPPTLSNLSSITVNIKTDSKDDPNKEDDKPVSNSPLFPITNSATNAQSFKTSTSPKKHFLNNLLTEKLKSTLPPSLHKNINQFIVPPVLYTRNGDDGAKMEDEIMDCDPLQDCDNYSKPTFSYKELIMITIFSGPSDSMCLNDIYQFIKKWFPYFQQDIGVTWQNSIRHNLSLNKCFIRLDPCETGTKVTNKPIWLINRVIIAEVY